MKSNLEGNWLHRLLARVTGLEKRLFQLQKDVHDLCWDDSFGMQNSAGLRRKLRKLKSGNRYSVAFLDLDCLHELNEFYGYIEVNRRIKLTFDISFRASDILGRVFSGDEILLVIPEDRPRLMKLLRNFQARGVNEGISFISTIRHGIRGPLTGDKLESLLGELGRELLELKRNRVRTPHPTLKRVGA